MAYTKKRGRPKPPPLSTVRACDYSDFLAIVALPPITHGPFRALPAESLVARTQSRTPRFWASFSGIVIAAEVTRIPSRSFASVASAGVQGLLPPSRFDGPSVMSAATQEVGAGVETRLFALSVSWS